MKIKKINANCKSRGQLYIYDHGESTQWISSGAAFYPIFDLPKFDPDTICTTYDITDKQQDKMLIQRYPALPINICFDDYCDSEQQVEPSRMRIIVHGKTLIPVLTSAGIQFINDRLLDPLSDIPSDDLSFFERVTDDGQIYFAVKQGLMITAVIGTFDILTDDFVDEVKSIATQCEIALYNKKADERCTAEPAENLLDDEKTVEV